MADLTRSIDITVPDAYVTRATAWINSLGALMEPSGEVDENGDPIYVPVAETLVQKFDRTAGDILKHQLRVRVLAYERKAAEQAVTEIEVQ